MERGRDVKAEDMGVEERRWNFSWKGAVKAVGAREGGVGDE